jgi:hypothetical protein
MENQTVEQLDVRFGFERLRVVLGVLKGNGDEGGEYPDAVDDLQRRDAPVLRGVCGEDAGDLPPLVEYHER